MTAQQCAERQAARDNLVQELVDALEWARNYVDTIVDPRALPLLVKMDSVLAKAKERA